MYGLNELSDDNPLLATSPLVMGVAKTLKYAQEHGNIELTKLGFFKRSFVHWAAASFDWPYYSEQDLFRMNKVLNEPDYLPLFVMHPLLLHTKIARHFKSTFRLTRAGTALIDRPGKILAAIAEPFLFEFNHTALSRHATSMQPTWMIVMNILNIEAENGLSRKRAGELIFPKIDPPGSFDMRASDAYISVLRPLCWLGFLIEHRHADIQRRDETIFIKSPLWKAAMRLPTDGMLRPQTMH
jgi:hypothetical protein